MHTLSCKTSWVQPVTDCLHLLRDCSHLSPEMSFFGRGALTVEHLEDLLKLLIKFVNLFYLRVCIILGQILLQPCRLSHAEGIYLHLLAGPWSICYVFNLCSHLLYPYHYLCLFNPFCCDTCHNPLALGCYSVIGSQLFRNVLQ